METIRSNQKIRRQGPASSHKEVIWRIEREAPMSILPSLKRHVNAKSTDKKELFHLFLDGFLDLEFRHGMILRHVFAFPSSRFLPILRKNNVTLTGYLPTVSNLSSDWPEFLDSVCPDVPKELTNAEMPRLGRHGSSGDPDGIYQGAKEVWAEGTEYTKALCTFHAFDYACWDLPKGVPPVCQDVFSGDEFIDSVMPAAKELTLVVNS